MIPADYTFQTPKGLSRLNPYLIEKQNLTGEDIELIKSLHIEKDGLELEIEAAEINDSNREHYLLLFEDLQYRLQDAWKFGRNRNYHKFFEIPKCRCGKYDNLDMLGTEYRYYSEGCPWGFHLTNEQNTLG